MSPEKMIRLSFAAPAAKLYEVFYKLGAPLHEMCRGRTGLFMGQLLCYSEIKEQKF